MLAIHQVSAPPVVPVRGALPAAPQFIDLAYLGRGRSIPGEMLSAPGTDNLAVVSPGVALPAPDRSGD